MDTAPMSPTPGAHVIDAATHVGQVTLGVRDLDAQVGFYERLIGLGVRHKTADSAELGTAMQTLVRLELRPEGSAFPRSTGLFHLALLLPDRTALGHWLRHYVHTTQRMVDGAGDHLVSQALYLGDPEGNGLEIYYDRPRDSWQREPSGGIKMATLAVDLPALVADAPDVPFTRLPDAATLGHVHLQVAAVEPVLTFYRDLIGFSHMASYPSAVFLGAGGYHHHVGANTWQSRGSAPPPEGALGLISYSIVLPNEAARTAVGERLTAAEVVVADRPDGLFVRDPSGNGVVLKVADAP